MHKANEEEMAAASAIKNLLVDLKDSQLTSLHKSMSLVRLDFRTDPSKVFIVTILIGKDGRVKDEDRYRVQELVSRSGDRIVLRVLDRNVTFHRGELLPRGVEETPSVRRIL